MIQTPEKICKAIADLRKYIDDDTQDPIGRRIAQEVESALRWATEDTVDWDSPVDSVKGMALILRKDLRMPPHES